MVWLASRREIIDRVRRRSFVVLTALLCALIIAAGVLFTVIRDDSRPSYDVGILTGSVAVVGFDQALESIGAAADVDVAIVELDDAAGAEALLRDGEVDVIVDTGREVATWNEVVADELGRIVDTAWATVSVATAATDAGLVDAEIEAILSPEPLATDVLDPRTDQLLGLLVGFASAVLLFVSITTFGGYVLTGVVEEKSTGVIEVLLSHVRAHQLMAGKVFGIGAVALVQFSAAVLAGLVSLRISGTEVPAEVWIGLPATIVWFVGGFLLYSTLFALAGSFVSRVEDAQGAAAPITSAFTIGYVLVFTFGSDPASTAARVLSVLPPFAPLLMPLRMVTGAASVVEILVAAVLLAIAVAAMIRLAGTVYARTLLHRGRRLRWREALRRDRTDTAPAA
ncbi:MAG TPA: ABC transporter permease [Ilumatobacteraceae bacterium]|nr:ABC transporter permease [Ilumatobacteraceae bacterium]